MNCPAPVVVRFPETLIVVLAAAVIPVEENVRLLKLCVPDPLIPVLAPSKITVPVLPV